MKTTNTKKYKL